MKKKILKENVFDVFFKVIKGAKLSLQHIHNAENKIRVSDFKVITESIGPNNWSLTMIGPDNTKFAIKHPKYIFTSSTWIIAKHSKIVPWFLSELPDFLFLYCIQWWMRLIAYKAWTSKDGAVLTYSELIMG